MRPATERTSSSAMRVKTSREREQAEQGPQEVVAGGEEGAGHGEGEQQLEQGLILLPEGEGLRDLGDEAEALDGLHGGKQREEAEDGDDREVLCEQDGEAGLAAASCEEIPLVERGEDDGGGGHRPDEAERHGEVPLHAERDGDGGDGGGGDNDLESSEADDVAAEGAEDGRLDLQADEEEHHHDAELGEVEDLVGGPRDVEVLGADDNAGAEVAEDCAEPEPLGERHTDGGGGEIDDGVEEEGVAHAAPSGGRMKSLRS
jgi:hypothetical protein